MLADGGRQSSKCRCRMYMWIVCHVIKCLNKWSWLRGVYSARERMLDRTARAGFIETEIFKQTLEGSERKAMRNVPGSRNASVRAPW